MKIWLRKEYLIQMATITFIHLYTPAKRDSISDPEDLKTKLFSILKSYSCRVLHCPRAIINVEIKGEISRTKLRGFILQGVVTKVFVLRLQRFSSSSISGTD